MRFTRSSGAIHFSDAAPKLKKLSCTSHTSIVSTSQMLPAPATRPTMHNAASSQSLPTQQVERFHSCCGKAKHGGVRRGALDQANQTHAGEFHVMACPSCDPSLQGVKSAVFDRLLRNVGGSRGTSADCSWRTLRRSCSWCMRLCRAFSAAARRLASLSSCCRARLARSCARMAGSGPVSAVLTWSSGVLEHRLWVLHLTVSNVIFGRAGHQGHACSCQWRVELCCTHRYMLRD